MNINAKLLKILAKVKHKKKSGLMTQTTLYLYIELYYFTI